MGYSPLALGYKITTPVVHKYSNYKLQWRICGGKGQIVPYPFSLVDTYNS